MTDNHSDLEGRVSAALDSRAADLAPSSPPAFSWEIGAEEFDSDAPIAHRDTRRVSRRALAAGSGLVAAVAVAAVVATTLSGPSATSGHSAAQGRSSEQPSRATASAPALLLAAAHTRLSTGDTPLADGQYRYIKTVGPAPEVIETQPAGSTAPPHTIAPPAGSYTLDELWIPKDQSDTWERRQSVVNDPRGGPASVWKGRCDDLYAHTQDGPKGPACTRQGSFDDPTPAFIAGLPRNADRLYAQLRSYSEQRLNPDKIHDVNFEMFFEIDGLLQSGVITSDLTSTLYDVLSRIPGISVVQHCRNYSGTEGTGFRISTTFGQGKDALPSTQTIIVDLHTGNYLGDRTVEKGGDSSSAVTVGVADHLGQPGT